jgi:hypothetical protein
LIALLQYSTDIPAIYTQFLTLVTMSLPLSSLWASASIDGLAKLSDRKPILVGTYGMRSSVGKSTYNQKSMTSAGCRDLPVSPTSGVLPEESDLELGRTCSSLRK